MHADSVARGWHQRFAAVAHRKQAFLEAWPREGPLGHPIEIISGMEEARLIYSGVAHTMPNGAWSTDSSPISAAAVPSFIIGDGLTPLELESLQMGLRYHSASAFFPRRQDLGQNG